MGSVCLEIRYNVPIVSLLHEVAIQTYAASQDLRSTSFKFWSALWADSPCISFHTWLDRQVAFWRRTLQHLICKEGASWLYRGIFNGYDTGTPSPDVCGICQLQRFFSPFFFSSSNHISSSPEEVEVAYQNDMSTNVKGSRTSATAASNDWRTKSSSSSKQRFSRPTTAVMFVHFIMVILQTVVIDITMFMSKWRFRIKTFLAQN